MTTLQEIEASLPKLPTVDLYQIECRIRELYRQREERILYDDAYGLWMMEDQTSAAAEVFSLLDEQEEKAQDGESQTR
jgi:hypothetical protein